mgnify:CR=1 FL=1
MIKAKTLLLALASMLLITGCGDKGGSDNPPEPEKTNFEKALAAVASFDIEKTNGYDYSLKQYLGRDEANSDVISLRADFSGSIKAQKDETHKRLNTYGSGEQFTTTVTTTYFSDNMICEYKNNQWKWTNYKKSDYFAISISQINFDKSYLTSIKESLDSKYVLSADIPDAKVKEFLNSETASFTSVSLKLTTSSDFSNFESLELSYFQTNTRSEMKFEVYRGNVSIDLPN